MENENKKYRYKGYIIIPSPRHYEDGKWGINFNIIIDLPSSTIREEYFADPPQFFATEKEAEEASINYAKTLIDSFCTK